MSEKKFPPAYRTQEEHDRIKDIITSNSIHYPKKDLNLFKVLFGNLLTEEILRARFTLEGKTYRLVEDTNDHP